MISTLPLNFFPLWEDVNEPKYATEQSACFDLEAHLPLGSGTEAFAPDGSKQDLCALIGGGILIPPHWRVKIPTGIIFDIAQGFKVNVYIRSGTSYKKGLILTNGTGIIDSDYVDPVFISVTNISDVHIGIQDHERIAQGELLPVCRPKFNRLTERPKQKTTRDGGFGHTDFKYKIQPS